MSMIIDIELYVRDGSSGCDTHPDSAEKIIEQVKKFYPDHELEEGEDPLVWAQESLCCMSEDAIDKFVKQCRDSGLSFVRLED